MSLATPAPDADSNASGVVVANADDGASNIDRKPQSQVRRRQQSSSLLGIGILTGLVALAIWGLVLGHDREEPNWDPRVAELADQVEQIRGLRFITPIELITVDSESFAELAAVSGHGFPAVDAGEHSLAVQRALGLRSGSAATATSGLIAHGQVIYDTRSASLRVIAGAIDTGELSQGLEIDLVHQLAHGLQHQHDLAGANSQPQNRAQSSAVEGDARRVEQQFRRSLDAETGQATEPVDDQYGRALAAAPALLGEMWVLRLYESGGYRLLNEEFDRSDEPSEGSVFYPFGAESDSQARLSDAEAEGRHRASDQQVGPTSLYLMFAGAMPPHAATTAAFGWSEDRLAVGATDGRVCIALRVQAQSRRDIDELEAAAAVWAAVGPPAAERTATRLASHIELRGCDPGPEVEIPVVVDGDAAIDYVASWTGYTVLLDQVSEVSTSQAKCMVPLIFATISLDDLITTRTTDRNVFGERPIIRQIERARRACDLI